MYLMHTISGSYYMVMYEVQYGLRDITNHPSCRIYIASLIKHELGRKLLSMVYGLHL